MPSKNVRAGRVLLELLVTLLIGLAPVSCALLVVVWQVDKKLEATAEVAMRETLHHTDALIDALHQASNKVLSLADFPCDKALPTLRTEVVMHSTLRSLVLVRENRAYCSTVHGESQLLVNPGHYFNQRLRLEAGNDVTPDSAILYYRLQEYPFGVLALSDARHLQQVIRAIKADVTLLLEFGDDYMAVDGIVDGTLPEHREQHVRAMSEYGYAVHAGYPAGYTWNETIANARAVAPSVLLVGLLTAIAAYWAMFRQRRR